MLSFSYFFIFLFFCLHLVIWADDFLLPPSSLYSSNSYVYASSVVDVVVFPHSSSLSRFRHRVLVTPPDRNHGVDAVVSGPCPVGAATPLSPSPPCWSHLLGQGKQMQPALSPAQPQWVVASRKGRTMGGGGDGDGAEGPAAVESLVEMACDHRT